MKVFVMGGPGLVGSRLVPRLCQRNDQVVLLTRRPAAAREQFGSACTFVDGDPMAPGPWQDAAADCDAAINLVGENIFARRWSDEFKKLLRESRVNSAAHIVQALAKS